MNIYFDQLKKVYYKDIPTLPISILKMGAEISRLFSCFNCVDDPPSPYYGPIRYRTINIDTITSIKENKSTVNDFGDWHIV
jgi:hypothetical protein